MNELIDLTIKNDEPVIDTVTIAEKIDTEHRAILQLLRKYLPDFNDMGRVAFEMRSFETAGGTQKREIALLNENQAILLFTYLRNSDVARAVKKQIVRSFARCRQELALKKAFEKFNIPRSFSEALHLAAELEEKHQKLLDKVAEDAPKVEFTDAVISTGEEETITGASKILGISPRKFFDWLRQRGYLYLQSNQATQRAIDSGWMVVRFARILTKNSVEQKAYPHVTGKGLYFFYQKLRNENLVERNQNLELS